MKFLVDNALGAIEKSKITRILGGETSLSAGTHVIAEWSRKKSAKEHPFSAEILSSSNFPTEKEAIAKAFEVDGQRHPNLLKAATRRSFQELQLNSKVIFEILCLTFYDIHSLMNRIK